MFVLGTLPLSVGATHTFLRDRIQSHFLTVGYSKLNTLTLVKVGPSESIRLYSQINTVISEDTVKEPGLLSYLVPFPLSLAIQQEDVYTAAAALAHHGIGDIRRGDGRYFCEEADGTDG